MFTKEGRAIFRPGGAGASPRTCRSGVADADPPSRRHDAIAVHHLRSNRAGRGGAIRPSTAGCAAPIASTSRRIMAKTLAKPARIRETMRAPALAAQPLRERRREPAVRHRSPSPGRPRTSRSQLRRRHAAAYHPAQPLTPTALPYASSGHRGVPPPAPPNTTVMRRRAGFTQASLTSRLAALGGDTNSPGPSRTRYRASGRTVCVPQPVALFASPAAFPASLVDCGACPPRRPARQSRPGGGVRYSNFRWRTTLPAATAPPLCRKLPVVVKAPADTWPQPDKGANPPGGGRHDIAGR